ncbi:serine/threonine-protein kinase [Streptomyces sp. NPDC093801]|uniref:serine/threonine-protein kinase n=1 Tax=Streptomyces sp. NPDC093801 TaxID=3155203 RepID=UPI00344DFF6C
MEPLRSGDPLDIGGYRLLARLGEGGMGEVFLARTASGRALALKTVHRELSRDPGFTERFDREIRTNDRVRSPWTVSVVDFSPAGSSAQWLATEYVPAPSLADWVRREGPLPEPAVRSLARELAAALVSVRDAGVVHRDIKPANVLLGPERPFLIDFGIARAVRDPRRTRTGAVVGTPGYLSPEQATGDTAGHPADVFSLAAVLVHAATGRGPFLAHGEEPSLPVLLYRIVHDEPRLDGVPPPLLPLLRDCLAKDPGRRPTAEELGVRLGPAEADGWAGAAPPALAADTGRREAELRALLTAPGPAAAPPPPCHVPPECAQFGPAVPPVPPAASPPPARRRLLLGGAAGAAALAALLLLLPRLAGGGGGDADGKAAERPAPTPSPAVSALPASWAGTWTGLGPGTPDADGITRARTRDFAVTVTFQAGSVGELTGRQISSVREISSGRDLGCTEALELRQLRGATAYLAAATSRPTDRTATFDCPKGNLYVVTMTGPDTLTVELEGAQSAGAPSTLTRAR